MESGRLTCLEVLSEYLLPSDQLPDGRALQSPCLPMRLRAGTLPTKARAPKTRWLGFSSIAFGHTDNIFNQMLTVTVNCDNRLSRKVLTDYFFLNVSKGSFESSSFSFIDRMGKDSRSNKSRFVVIVVIAWATPIINNNNTGFRELLW